ncbi:MAG: hypothetical protein K0S24_1134 [Sphingobacterium sp.]|jgi:hypothetical protein|nr:hypothetical protein [Sphingobacterium sp.]
MVSSIHLSGRMAYSILGSSKYTLMKNNFSNTKNKWQRLK